MIFWTTLFVLCCNQALARVFPSIPVKSNEDPISKLFKPSSDGLSHSSLGDTGNGFGIARNGFGDLLNVIKSNNIFHVKPVKVVNSSKQKQPPIYDSITSLKVINKKPQNIIVWTGSNRKVFNTTTEQIARVNKSASNLGSLIAEYIRAKNLPIYHAQFPFVFRLNLSEIEITKDTLSNISFSISVRPLEDLINQTRSLLNVKIPFNLANNISQASVFYERWSKGQNKKINKQMKLLNERSKRMDFYGGYGGNGGFGGGWGGNYGYGGGYNGFYQNAGFRAGNNYNNNNGAGWGSNFNNNNGGGWGNSFNNNNGGFYGGDNFNNNNGK